MSRILVTGAAGFVGRRVCAALAGSGCTPLAAVRSAADRARLPEAEFVAVGDLASPVEWDPVLEGVSGVVHLAARVHVMRESSPDASAAYRALNLDATIRLAEAAARRGVGRFVFVSTVKVMGEGRAQSYVETDTPAPTGAYAVTKLQAEDALREIEARTGMSVCILRPPLVYGPGVGGNFVQLFRLVEWASRVPLPLGRIRNQRSLLFVDNLASAILLGLRHPSAGGAFLVSDGEDLSTTELLERLAELLGRRLRLFTVSDAWVRRAGRALGISAPVERLFGSLTVDASRFQQRLGWKPPCSVEEGLASTVAWYRESERR